MKIPSLEDVNGKQIFEGAKHLYAEGDYIKALELIQDLSFVKGRDRALVKLLQGSIFKDLAVKSENGDAKFTYFLGSVEIYSGHSDVAALAAVSLFNLAKQIESVLYYKKSLKKAKECSSTSTQLKCLIETAESRIAESRNRVGSSAVKNRQEKVEENEETRKSDSDFIQRLRLYWTGLNVERKRDFMKVSTAEFGSYVERLYGREGRDALERVLDSARKDTKWRFWMCRACSKKFSSPDECRNHLEQEHDAEFKLSLTEFLAQRISKVWARKISSGGWEPVDTVAAVEIIKNQLEDVTVFAYVNGWSKDWPLAADEERGKLLQDIRSLLLSFCDRKILSCSLRDWVIDFVVSQLKKLEVSKDILRDCRLVETPQSICFLECRELNQILDFLKNIKCERDDGTDLVSRAVDSFFSSTQVKEKIDFDAQFSFLLLDKRLLQCKIARFDDEGTISFFDPNVHYTKSHAHGGDILSWLTYHSSRDERFRFPRPIRAHNLDVWLAVLRAV